VNGENVIAISGVEFRTPGLGHVLGKPHPRLRQCQPKGFVLLVACSPRHGNTFFRALSMILGGSHNTIPD
jgi:hypothetical protein